MEGAMAHDHGARGVLQRGRRRAEASVRPTTVDSAPNGGGRNEQRARPRGVSIQHRCACVGAAAVDLDGKWGKWEFPLASHLALRVFWGSDGEVS